MARTIDLTGQRFGMLVAIKRGSPHQSPSRKQVTWVCKCDCGETVTVQRSGLRNGATLSCGCLRGKVDAAKSALFASRKAEYNCWSSMKDRCLNRNNQDFAIYGGRGIKVCDRWSESFGAFFEDMGARPSARHSIDRINSDGDYEPSNCRWALPCEQNRNKRSNRFIEFNGKRQVISDWAKDLGISFSSLSERLQKHPADIALTMKKGVRHGS